MTEKTGEAVHDERSDLKLASTVPRGQALISNRYVLLHEGQLASSDEIVFLHGS